jgi:hypothetical protein
MTPGCPSTARLAALPLAICLLTSLAACQSVPQAKTEQAVVAAPDPVAPPPPPPPAVLPEAPALPAPAKRTAVVSTAYSVEGAILPVVKGRQMVETRTDMRRTDSLHSFDNQLLRAFSGEASSADIVRLDRKLLWSLNTAQKIYTECPLTGCQAPTPSRTQPAIPERPSEPSCAVTVRKNELRTTPTGERKSINNFPTEHYQISWVTELADSQGRISTNRVMLDLWTTPETGAVKEAQSLDLVFSKRWAGAVSVGDQPFNRYVPREVLAPLNSLMGRAAASNKATATWTKEFAKVRGYPVQTTLSWTTRGNACGDATASGAAVNGTLGGKGDGNALLTFHHEVKSIEMRLVSDAWFAPASDYQKVQ